ncbi:unnamed protein product [Musa hybrid cultivar]
MIEKLTWCDVYQYPIVGHKGKRERKQFNAHLKVAINQTDIGTTYLVAHFRNCLLCHRIVACNSHHVHGTKASHLLSLHLPSLSPCCAASSKQELCSAAYAYQVSTSPLNDLPHARPCQCSLRHHPGCRKSFVELNLVV